MGDDVGMLILAELRALNARIDRLDRAGYAVPPSHGLVIAIGQHVGERAFTAAELIRHGEAAAPALLSAIETACGRISARSLGKKLAKMSGTSIAGMRVESLAEERSGRLWRVVPLRV
ncbi:MAG: hypothetical protein B7Z14_14955 [Bosea sp. 32-68-6]|nr:MAG: hypothetical protein B7Z14_14955 [Bosea sp. 32-68-6]